MKRAILAALVVGGCASVPRATPVVEGRTPGGIAYDVRGSGPTVVLLHGGVLDRRMWDDDVAAFARRFRVVRYDLRGHGRSPDVREPFSPVDDLAAVLDAVGAPRAHLVGLSLGSRVALDFALTHPDRVDRLVLVGPFPSGAQVTEMPAGLDSLMAAASRGDVNRAAALAADMPAFAAPRDKAQWVRSLVMANARLFGQSPTAERQMSPPAMARLAEVRVPTLIVVGDRDSRDLLKAADSLTAGIRGAQRVTVRNAGHLVNVWEPGVFSRVVVRFLEGLRVEGGGWSERDLGRRRPAGEGSLHPPPSALRPAGP
ncbi:MAG: alpha/beta fold hydrolase [Gemmatimonadaceae bacterium]